MSSAGARFQENPDARSSEPVVKRFGFMSQISPDGRYVVTSIGPPGLGNKHKDELPDFAPGLADRLYSMNFQGPPFNQVFYPTRGILAFYDRTEQKLRPLPGADDPRFVQTSAFWSPDGKYLIFSRADRPRSVSRKCCQGRVRQRRERNANPVRPLQDSFQRRQRRQGRAGGGRFQQRHEQQLSQGHARRPLDRLRAKPQRPAHASRQPSVHRAVHRRQSPPDELQHRADEFLAHLLAQRPMDGVFLEGAFALHPPHADAHRRQRQRHARHHRRQHHRRQSRRQHSRVPQRSA